MSVDILELLAGLREEIAIHQFAIISAQTTRRHDVVNEPIHTLGLCTLGLPELCITGIEEHAASHVIAHVAKLQIEQGPLTSGRRLDKELFIDGSDTVVVVNEVSPEYVESTFQFDFVLFPDRKVQAMQLVWPDNENRLPWDPASQAVQKLLGKVPE